MCGMKNRANICVMAVSFVDAAELRSVRAFLRTSYAGGLKIGGIWVDEGIRVQQLESVKVVC